MGEIAQETRILETRTDVVDEKHEVVDGIDDKVKLKDLPTVFRSQINLLINVYFEEIFFMKK